MLKSPNTEIPNTCVDSRIPTVLSDSIVLNSIQTPDGTIIISRNTYDFVRHLDANGCEYFVDGGNQYLRRGGNDDYTEMSVTMGSRRLEDLVTIACWGTRGVDGKSPLSYMPIADMSTDHLKAVLGLTYAIQAPLEFLMKWELNRRSRLTLGEAWVEIIESKYK